MARKKKHKRKEGDVHTIAIPSNHACIDTTHNDRPPPAHTLQSLFDRVKHHPGFTHIEQHNKIPWVHVHFRSAEAATAALHSLDKEKDLLHKEKVLKINGVRRFLP